MEIRRKAGAAIAQTAVYLLAALVFLIPLIRLLLMAVTQEDGCGLDNFAELLAEERTREAIVNTVIIAVSSTLFAAVAGSGLAFLVAYCNIRRKGLLEFLILLPFIVPSYIITLSWSGFLSSRGAFNTLLTSLGLPAVDIYTIGGIILVLGICNIPIVYINVVHMLRKIPRDMEWAARACGYSQRQAMLKINLISAIPAIAAGSVLAFLSAIDNFSVPAFLGISSGIPVLSTYIYEKAIGFGPNAFPLAAALSLILSLIAVAGTLLEGFFVRRSASMDSIKEDYSVRVYFKPGLRRGLEWGILGIFLALNIIPMASMVSSSFLKAYGLKFRLENLTLDNFAFLVRSRGVTAAVKNSLLLAVVTCLVCIVAGTAIAYVKLRKKSRAAVILEKCASLTYAIPGIVLALAMIFHWVEPVPGFRPGVYGTIYILVIAYITRYLVLQIKGSTTALLTVDPAMEEAASASGRGFFARWFKILIPLLAGPILSGAFMIFVPALTELTLSSMLASAGTKTIGLTIFNYQQGGDYNLAAAMSVVVTVLVVVGYCLINRHKLSSASSKKEEKDYEPAYTKSHKELQPNSGTQGN